MKTKLNISITTHIDRWISSIEEVEILKDRAYAFLRNAERLFLDGEYDLAAFNIEQFCQLLLKYKLLVKTGTYPRHVQFYAS